MAIHFYDRRTGTTTPVKSASELDGAREKANYGVWAPSTNGDPKRQVRERQADLKKNPATPGRPDDRVDAEARSAKNANKQRKTDSLIKGMYDKKTGKKVSPKKAAKKSALRNVRMATRAAGIAATKASILHHETSDGNASSLELKRASNASSRSGEARVAAEEMKTAALKTGVRKRKVNKVAKLSDVNYVAKNTRAVKRKDKFLKKTA